jgi:hypothetical protein
MCAMRSLRPPLVVTLSLASLTPCCNDEPARPSVTPDPRPRAPTSVPAPSPRSEFPAKTMTEPHSFEERETIVNPRVGRKRVIWGGGSSCFTFGPEDAVSSGIQFARQPVPCPEGIATLLANCAGDLLHRRGDACACEAVEGNPPGPEQPVACPEPKP